MRCRQSDDWNQLVHTLAADSTQLRHDDGLRKCCCQSYDVQPSGGGSWSHRSREQRRMSQRQLGWMPQGDISATSRFSDTPRQPHTHPRRHGSSTANSAGQIYTRIGGEGTTRSRTLGDGVIQYLASMVRALVSMCQDSMVDGSNCYVIFRPHGSKFQRISARWVIENKNRDMPSPLA